MLYLNTVFPMLPIFPINHLTLTSVVFEFIQTKEDKHMAENLTLTSVVFEYYWSGVGTLTIRLFNFNKCCI